MGVNYLRFGNLSKAQTLFEDILPKYKKYLGEEHINVAHALYHLRKVYLSISLQSSSSDPNLSNPTLMDKAEECYALCFNTYNHLLDKNHILLAHMHLSFGFIYGTQAKFFETKRNLLEAVNIYKRHNEGKNFGVVTCFKMLGEVCTCTGEHQKSMSYFEEAVELSETLFGEVHLTVADTLHNLGGVNVKFGRYHEAIDCYTRVLKIQTGSKNNHDLLYAQTLNNLGIVHARLGHHSRTVVLLNSGLKLRLKHHEDTEEIASTFYFLGNAYAKNGLVASAIRCYNEALRIHRKLYGEDHPCVAKTLHNLGVLHVENKANNQARIYFNQALEVKKIFFDPESLSVAVTLMKIGDVCRNDDCSKSLSCYLKVLKAQKKHLGPDHVEVGRTLLKVGGVRKLTGSFDLALMTLHESLRIFDYNSSTRVEDSASASYQLATVLEKL